MKKSTLYALWGVLYIVCAALGFLEAPEGVARGMLLAISVLFFVPPGILLYDAAQKKDNRTKKTVGTLAAASLILTVAALAANILSAFQAEWVGTLCHIVLNLVSVPMLCSNYWAIPLFLWAVLLFAARKK